MSDSDSAEKKKRKPGPRPKAEHYVSFTITMSPADVLRLEEQQQATGHSRSELLRRAWQGLPLSPRTRHSLAVVKFYRELIELVAGLQQLGRTEQLGPGVPAKVELGV